ncbi:helix-turn-helix transcriptional regulator [Fructobacillus evanidus]|uniref:helix-turn-helix domain-containing protein n=1 Tax=Fructobacillus evanidus TaxID=3064281 RepID=UPI0030C8C19A
MPLVYHGGHMSKNRLNELRKSKGLTLSQVHRKLGMKRQTYTNYEYGSREPKLETWEKLAKFYGVTPAYLVGWED